MIKQYSSLIALGALAFAFVSVSAPHHMNATHNLQGIWSCVSASVDGRALPPETPAALHLTLTADRYQTKKGNPDRVARTYTLNASTTPKQINMLGTEGDLAG